MLAHHGLEREPIVVDLLPDGERVEQLLADFGHLIAELAVAEDVTVNSADGVNHHLADLTGAGLHPDLRRGRHDGHHHLDPLSDPEAARGR